MNLRLKQEILLILTIVSLVRRHRMGRSNDWHKGRTWFSFFSGYSFVGWQSGFWAKNGVITIQEHVSVDRHVGEATVPDGDIAGRSRALNYTLAFALWLRKNHANTSIRVIREVWSWLVKYNGHRKTGPSTGVLKPGAFGSRVKQSLSILEISVICRVTETRSPLIS